jgi:hypothetical protein
VLLPIIGYFGTSFGVKFLMPDKQGLRAEATALIEYRPARARTRPPAAPSEASEARADERAAAAQPNDSRTLADPAADARLQLLSRQLAGRYAVGIANALLYLAAAVALAFGATVAIGRMGFGRFFFAALALAFVVGLVATAAVVPAPYDFGRPILIDNLLDAADRFEVFAKFGATGRLQACRDGICQQTGNLFQGTGDRFAFLVTLNTFAALIPVSTILLALGAISVRYPSPDLELAGLHRRLSVIRFALGCTSVLLVTSVFVSKTLLEWPQTLIDEAQAQALKPIADAMTLQLGAAGTIALIAAFAPAITAWMLDVARYRGRLPRVRRAARSRGRSGDDLDFAPGAWATALIAALAPIFAAPFVEALKTLLGVLPVR